VAMELLDAQREQRREHTDEARRVDDEEPARADACRVFGSSFRR